MGTSKNELCWLGAIEEVQIGCTLRSRSCDNVVALPHTRMRLA